MSSVLSTKKIINQTYQKWTESFSSYPADEYTLRAYFYKDSANKFGIDGTADGTDFELILNPALEGYKDKTHGLYSYQLTAAKDGVTYPVENGTILFLPNLEVDTDPRGYWTRIYEAYKTAYETLTGTEASSVDVLGMSVTYEKRNELLAMLLDAEQRMNVELGSPKAKSKLFKARFR